MILEINWLLLFGVFVCLATANSGMIKYASKYITWQENLAYSRIPSLFYTIFLLARHFRWPLTKYHWISLTSGILVVMALPITYSLIKRLELSVYNPIQVITTAMVVLMSYIVFKDSMSLYKGIGIACAMLALIFLALGNK